MRADQPEMGISLMEGGELFYSFYQINVLGCTRERNKQEFSKAKSFLYYSVNKSF